MPVTTLSLTMCRFLEHESTNLSAGARPSASAPFIGLLLYKGVTLEEIRACFGALKSKGMPQSGSSIEVRCFNRSGVAVDHSEFKRLLSGFDTIWFLSEGSKPYRWVQI